jgi:hypothetical protein
MMVMSRPSLEPPHRRPTPASLCQALKTWRVPLPSLAETIYSNTAALTDTGGVSRKTISGRGR